MFEIVETAKKVLVKLNEIQPAVSVAGMDEAAEMIKAIKGDLVMMVASISPDHPCMERVLIALHEDALSSASALYKLLYQLIKAGIISDSTPDEQLQVAALAAEAFVLRTRDYLDSKRKAFELNGGNYGRA